MSAGKLVESVEKVKAGLDAASVSQITAALDALETASPLLSTATIVSSDAQPAGEAADPLTMTAVSEVIDLCGGSDDDWSGTAAASAEDAVADAVVVQSAAGKVDPNAPKISKDVSSHAELQAMVAGQMKSSYTETCTRLAVLMKERVDALSGALNA